MLPNKESKSSPSNQALQIPARNVLQSPDRNAKSDHEQIQSVKSSDTHAPQIKNAEDRQIPINQSSNIFNKDPITQIQSIQDKTKTPLDFSRKLIRMTDLRQWKLQSWRNSRTSFLIA